MRTDRTKKEYIPFVLGSLIWALTVVWINFHGAQWYNFDMFADASFARRAAEQNTLFPQDWIFGNQYYVIATPAVASLFYRLCHSSVFAMSCASSLMFCLILLCYVWLCRPLFSTGALWAGLFCMAGGTILGDSISSSTYGFQILHTMASYYACYLLVILLHLGIWVRLRKRMSVSPIILIIALMSSLALGIQSPRETLSLCIPLLVITLVLWMYHRGDSGEKKSLIFAAFSLTGNLLGLWLNGGVRQRWGTHVLSNVSTAGNGAVSDLSIKRVAESGHAFLELVGLRYLNYSWKWKPLAAMGLFLLLLAIAALTVGWKKDKNPDICKSNAHTLNDDSQTTYERTADSLMPVLFCWISLLGVFAAGVLFIQVRAIYYFVWYLLVPLSVSVLYERLPAGRRTLFCVAVLLCGALNFFYNVYPDISRYREQKQFYSGIASQLEKQGVETIYGDYQAPTIVACSGERFEFGSIFPNAGAEAGENEADDLLIPYGSPVSTKAYHQVEPEYSRLILSDSPYDELSGYRYLTRYMTGEYQKAFQIFFKEEECFTSPQITYHVYSFTNPNLFPDEMIP